MAKPSTRQQLIDFCLRKLGDGVIQINVSPDQLEDCADDALQFFAEFHFDGVEEVFLKHTVTSDEVAFGSTSGYLELPIPNNITAIQHVFSLRDQFTKNFFDAEYQFVLNDIQNWGSLDLVGYAMQRQHYALLNYLLDPDPTYEYTRYKNTLKIVKQSDDAVIPGTVLLFQATAIVDPETYTDVYNDRYLKMYLTALIKRQWGQNLIKYDGVQLPGGTTLNGRQIYDDAVQEIEKLEEEMRNRYEEPPEWFTA